jgi:hypothetical protein
MGSALISYILTDIAFYPGDAAQCLRGISFSTFYGIDLFLRLFQNPKRSSSILSTKDSWYKTNCFVL